VAELDRARLKYKSEIDGVNTSVANMKAQLRLAQYYLDNTTLTAPEDGRIINLQVRPGTVSGIYRIGGIAALIADADRYLLATFYQENLNYVRRGQPVEVALDLYPGQIFAGKVDSIWRGNGVGQYLPSDEIPKLWEGQAGLLSVPAPPNVAQRQYAVKILLDDPDRSKFPIGAQGSAAIYTGGEHGAWAALRKISIRAHSDDNRRPAAYRNRLQWDNARLPELGSGRTDQVRVRRLARPLRDCYFLKLWRHSTCQTWYRAAH
jgi:multidrug efflux pump subunit AcrA (membrane-fusion protein)